MFFASTMRPQGDAPQPKINQHGLCAVCLIMRQQTGQHSLLEHQPSCASLKLTHGVQEKSVATTWLQGRSKQARIEHQMLLAQARLPTRGMHHSLKPRTRASDTSAAHKRQLAFPNGRHMLHFAILPTSLNLWALLLLGTGKDNAASQAGVAVGGECICQSVGNGADGALLELEVEVFVCPDFYPICTTRNTFRLSTGLRVHASIGRIHRINYCSAHMHGMSTSRYLSSSEGKATAAWQVSMMTGEVGAAPTHTSDHTLVAAVTRTSPTAVATSSIPASHVSWQVYASAHAPAYAVATARAVSSIEEPENAQAQPPFASQLTKE